MVNVKFDLLEKEGKETKEKVLVAVLGFARPNFRKGLILKVIVNTTKKLKASSPGLFPSLCFVPNS